MLASRADAKRCQPEGRKRNLNAKFESCLSYVCLECWNQAGVIWGQLAPPGAQVQIESSKVSKRFIKCQHEGRSSGVKLRQPTSMEDSSPSSPPGLGLHPSSRASRSIPLPSQSQLNKHTIEGQLPAPVGSRIKQLQGRGERLV